jgi:hypothetical protein
MVYGKSKIVGAFSVAALNELLFAWIVEEMDRGMGGLDE